MRGASVYILSPDNCTLLTITRIFYKEQRDMKSNFMLKVENAKMVDIKKALEGAGIKVRSIQEVYKEGSTTKPAES